MNNHHHYLNKMTFKERDCVWFCFGMWRFLFLWR